MACSQCSKPAMFKIPVDSGGGYVLLCLDCRIKYVNLLMAQNRALERQHNFLIEQMESRVGLTGILPRYPETQPIEIGAVQLNNFNIDRSTIGVLNVGALEMVDSAVTVLKESDQGAREAEAILELTQAVLASGGLQPMMKNEVLELLGGVATEATAPKESRRAAVGKALLSQLGTILTVVTDLAGLWDRVKPILYAIF